MIQINKRNIGVCVLLSIITCGIYGIYWMYLLVKNMESIKKRTNSTIGEMLCLFLIPFYSLYWWYTRGEDLKREFISHNYSVLGGGTIYLVLAIFGLGIVSMAIMQNDFNTMRTVRTEVIISEEKISEKNTTCFVPYMIAGIVPILILIIMIIKGSYVFIDNRFDAVAILWVNSIIIAVLSSLLVVAGSTLLAVYVQKWGNIGIICISILCLIVGDNFIAESIIFNFSVFRNVFCNMSMIPVITIIFSFIIRKRTAVNNYIYILLVEFVLLFGWFWGKTEFWGKSALSNIAYSSTYTDEGQPFTLLPYIIIPLVISFVGIAVTCGILSKSKNEIKNRNV